MPFRGRWAYAHGQGVTKDEAVAVKWYRKAADPGLAYAQCNLGVMYNLGLGVTKDEAEAYKWVLLAGAQSNEDAKRAISVIETSLTPTQRAEGQKRSGDWKAAFDSRNAKDGAAPAK